MILVYTIAVAILILIEGSLEVKLPTIWTDEKQRWEESEKRREEERRSQKRKSQKKEDPSARKGRRLAKHCFSNDLWLRRVEKSKSRLAEAQLHLQLQLQLHYTTLPPAVVVRWPLQPLQSLQKNNSNHLSVHQWIRSAIRDSQQPTSPVGFLFLKLPPPPCAVLLVLLVPTLMLIIIVILIIWDETIFESNPNHHADVFKFSETAPSSSKTTSNDRNVNGEGHSHSIFCLKILEKTSYKVVKSCLLDYVGLCWFMLTPWTSFMMFDEYSPYTRPIVCLVKSLYSPYVSGKMFMSVMQDMFTLM